MWFRHFGKNGRSCYCLFVLYSRFFLCIFTYLHNTIHGRIVQISGLLRSSCWNFDWEIWFNREAARVCFGDFQEMLQQLRCSGALPRKMQILQDWVQCAHFLLAVLFMPVWFLEPVLKHWYCFRCNQKMVYLAWQAWNHEVNFFVHLRLIFKQKPEKKSKTELKIKLPLT